jgi:hypothetical protein
LVLKQRNLLQQADDNQTGDGKDVDGFDSNADSMESAGGTGAAISATPSFSMEEIDRNGDTDNRKKENQAEDLL